MLHQGKIIFHLILIIGALIFFSAKFSRIFKRKGRDSDLGIMIYAFLNLLFLVFTW